MEAEIFDIIKAVNNLKDSIYELRSHIDLLSRKHSELLTPLYVNEKKACEILSVSPRTLAKNACQ